MTQAGSVRSLSPRDKSCVEEVQRLASTGAAGVGPLVALLSEPSWVVRRVTVGSLARLGTSAVVPLCGVLEGDRSDETSLAAAVEALVESVGEVEAAVMALAHRTSNPAVLCDVAQILGRRGARGAVSILAAWCSHPDDNVAVAALEALGRLGGLATIDPLLAAVRSRNLFRTFPAIALLGHSGDPRAISPLVELLDDPSYMAEAASAIGASGQPRGVPPLARLLTAEDDWVVRLAARALTTLRARSLDRFGEAAVVVAVFRDAVAKNQVVDRVRRALEGADTGDKIALATVLGWLDDQTGVETLIELIDAEGSTSQAVCDALRRLGPVAEPTMRAALRSEESGRRRLLLPLLAARRSVVGDVIACLDDPDATVRALACSVLGRIGDPVAVPPLFALVGDTNPRVSQAAIAAVQSLGSDDAKTYTLEAADSADVGTRRAGLRILSYFGYPEGLELLLAAIVDDDERIREAAASGLALLENARASSALIEASRHPSAPTRATSMRALGQAAAAPDVVSALQGGLADPDAWVRYYACQSLGKLRVAAAGPRIAALLDDPAGQVRVGAVEAISRIGGDSALAALDRASLSIDVDVRRAALVGLGRIRRPDALALLVRGAESPDPATRLAAISAIGETAGTPAVNALVRAGSDPDEHVRAAAFDLLATRPGSQVTRWLLDHLADERDRERALSALAHDVEGRIEGILSALATADARASSLLVEALLRMRRPNGNAAAEAVLHFDNVHARRAAAILLVGIGGDGLRGTLAEVAVADSDAEVRQICAAAS